MTETSNPAPDAVPPPLSATGDASSPTPAPAPTPTPTPTSAPASAPKRSRKMAARVTSRLRATLIQDLVSGEQDLFTLAEKHRLTPDALAEWIGNERNHRCLASLCLLADLQTQVMLSRFRMHAASRLIRLATGEAQDASADVARRACVDLLKLDLKRAEGFVERDVLPEATDPALAGVAALQAALGATSGATHHAVSDTTPNSESSDATNPH